MTLLVTGGNGFIGLNLMEYHQSLGKPCVLLSDRPPSSSVQNFLQKRLPNFQWIEGDVRQAKDLDDICQQYGVSKIIHAAAITAELEREKTDTRKILEVNLLGSVEVFECALRNQVQQVIQLSSGSIFGHQGTHDPLIDELTSPVLPETIYGISKLAAERTGLRYRNTRGLNVTVVRLGLVYGSWEYDTGVRDTLSLPLQLYWMAKEGRHAMVYNQIGTDYIYAKDVIQGLSLILEKGSSPEGLYQLASGQVWSLSHWLASLKERFPLFSYEIISQKENCNVGLIGPLLRSPMRIERMQRDFAYAPKFDQAKAFDDFMQHYEGDV
jgi:dTDP-glucose 4,6-dehydratase